MIKPSNAFTWVASAFNLLSATVYYAFYLLKNSLKCCFLLPYYVIKSYCFVGRTFLSVAPDLIAEIFAATLFIGLLGCLLFDIPREMRADDNRGRIVRVPADPPAPANTNDMGTNTTSTTTANAPEADTQADGNAQTNDTVARPGTNVETEANNAEVEKLKAAINTALEELMCPITFDLPVDPVVTEAGDVVAREAIMALIRQRGMRTLRSMRTNQPMGQRIAPSVAIRNVIEKLVESGAVDEEIVTAYRSGRENLEGRGNDADAQPQMRDRRGGIDGWLGVDALRRPNGEGGALDQLEALLDNEMNERLRALMEEDEGEDEGEELQALMEEDADEDNEMNEELQALMREDAEDILQEEMRRLLGGRGARRRRLPVMEEDRDNNDENQDGDED